MTEGSTLSTILDLLRSTRLALYRFSNLQIAGYPIDWALHALGAFVLVLVLLRYQSPTRAVLVTIAAMVLKEVIDVFAKSRAEYIRPPSIDHAGDVLFGLGGIAVGLLAWRFLRTSR